jgi:hypothetical protein
VFSLPIYLCDCEQLVGFQNVVLIAFAVTTIYVICTEEWIYVFVGVQQGSQHKMKNLWNENTTHIRINMCINTSARAHTHTPTHKHTHTVMLINVFNMLNLPK